MLLLFVLKIAVIEFAFSCRLCANSEPRGDEGSSNAEAYGEKRWLFGE